MSMCRVFSCVVGRGCLLWPVHSLGKTLLVFSLLHFVLQGQTCPLLQVYIDFLLLHSNPWWWIEHLFWVLVLKGIVGIHRTIQLLLISVDAEKVFDKIQHPFITTKNLQKVGIEIAYLNITNSLSDKSTQPIVFSMVKRWSVSSKIKNRISVPTLTAINQHSFWHPGGDI